MSEKIDLTQKKPKKEELTDYPLYPTLYLSDVKLPIDEKFMEKTVTAKVTLMLVGIRRDNRANKKDHVSYDLAVKDIEFLNVKELQVKDKLNSTFKKG